MLCIYLHIYVINMLCTLAYRVHFFRIISWKSSHIVLFYGYLVFCCFIVPQFIEYPLVERHLEYCQYFAIKNNTAMNTICYNITTYTSTISHVCIPLERVFLGLALLGLAV